MTLLSQVSLNKVFLNKVSLSKVSLSTLSLAVMLSSGSALAYEQGNTIVRGGIANVSPDSSSSELDLNGVAIPGTSADVDDDTQLGLTVTHMLTHNIGIELLAATPFTHTVSVKGNLLGSGLDAAEVKHLPPTVSAQFFPMPAESAFQPYVGVGLNYTFFFDEELTSEFKGTLGDGKINLDDSFGLAFEVGMDFKINDRLVLNAAIWKVDIDTTATIELDSGPEITADVEIDPLAYMVGVGYRF